MHLVANIEKSDHWLITGSLHFDPVSGPIECAQNEETAERIANSSFDHLTMQSANKSCPMGVNLCLQNVVFVTLYLFSISRTTQT